MFLKNPKLIKTLSVLFLTSFLSVDAQNVPEILSEKNEHYLPDFSYAGYHFGEIDIPESKSRIFLAEEFGVVPNDTLDDSRALLRALEETKNIKGNVILQLPPGRIILSDILYIERSNFILRGSGTGKEGTEIYCPRSMSYMDDPESLMELREYLVRFDKRQREEENNLDLPFSQFAWSGGIIWTQVPGERVKEYLNSYDQDKNILARVSRGERGGHVMKVADVGNIQVGDVVQLEIYNKEGKNGKIIQELYKGQDVEIGSHHWEFPDMALVREQVMVTGVSEKEITIKSPLTITILPEYEARLVEWKHLKEVGIEHMRIVFPTAPKIAHHVEEGYNAIYLTRLYNGWVDDVVITNADSGILTEGVANTTIQNVVTNGTNEAHYSVAMSGVYNVLVDNLKVENYVKHPLSFNTFAVKSVYRDCEVYIEPILDQHSGANHQNLFDNIKVHVTLNEENSYPLFRGGGAGYWKPSHGAFNTFWNIQVHFMDNLNSQELFSLGGMEDGPFARLIGTTANHEVTVEYGPVAYIEGTNKRLSIPSLYTYQLRKRLSQEKNSFESVK